MAHRSFPLFILHSPLYLTISPIIHSTFNILNYPLSYRQGRQTGKNVAKSFEELPTSLFDWYILQCHFLYRLPPKSRSILVRLCVYRDILDGAVEGK